MGGGYGWHNPWPFEWGGGETEDETIYEAMRSAVGTLAARDDSGIDGLWRQCRAGIYASAGTFVERAVMQVWPQTATDHIPLWEAFLRITPTAGASDEERREQIASVYTSQSLADGPHLQARLKAIDSRFAVVDQSHDAGTVTVLGNPYEADVPNYSTDFVLPILFQVGTPTPADQAKIARARMLLGESLPAWVDYAILMGLGFVLDQSVLDGTALTDA